MTTPDQRAIKNAIEFIEEHDMPSRDDLLTLAEDAELGNFDAQERLAELAEKYGVEPDGDAKKTAEEIALAIENQVSADVEGIGN